MPACEALDDASVDLVFLLLLPANPRDDPGNAPACVSRRLRDPDVARAIREARDAVAIQKVICGE